jgi:adenosylcobinamide-GDP ribazoletransferase
MTGRMPPPDTLVQDVTTCIGFYTRIPVPAGDRRSLADAHWAAPVAGAVAGMVVGLSLWLALALSVPAAIAAALALAIGIALTGALHEDGLADVTDGFGGGQDRERKLEIMKDSRLGTYGALALMLSLLARWGALTALAAASPFVMLLVVVAAHTASRALVPAFMLRVPPARSYGLSAGVGRPDPAPALVALAIGMVALVICGLWFALIATLLLAVVFLSLERLATSQIGGQTGDVLGALQQAGEIAVLVAAASLLA